MRARAYDRAATDTYLSTLTAKFHADALDLSEKYRADPAGLKSAYDGLVASYRNSHVFPDIDGAFTAQATNIGTMMQRSALDQWRVKQNDQQQATLLGNMSSRERTRQQVLNLDPHDPIAEQTLTRLGEEDVADIRAKVASGARSATQAERMILDVQQQTQVKLISARAGTLADADQVDAYRAKLKADLVAGKLKGLTDFDTLDGALAVLSNKKRIVGDTALRALDGDLKALLERAGTGTDGTADWAALEARGKALDPAGASAPSELRGAGLFVSDDDAAVLARAAAHDRDDALALAALPA